MHPSENIPSFGKFNVTIDNIPHGVLPPTEKEREWFLSMTNSDIRKYYKLIRENVNIKDIYPIGHSGITVGELALYIIRTNHTKRRRRY